jgi:trigger factor
MNVEINTVDYCKLAAHCEIDEKAVTTFRNKVVSEIRKTARIPGFRLGKASVQSVNYHYKTEIDARLGAVLFQDAYENVIKMQNLKPMGQPAITSVNLTEKSFSCDFTIHHKPIIELGQYNGFEIPKPQLKINAADLTQSILEKLRLQNGEYVEYASTDLVEGNDSIIIDYVTKLDGVIQDTISGTNATIRLTDNQPFPEFHNAVLGMAVGEERIFDALVPENSNLSAFSGKTLNFTVKVLGGTKFVPAALDDALAVKVGVKSFDDLITHINTISSERVLDYLNQAIAEQIAGRLIEGHDFKVPAWLTSADAQIQAKSEGMDWSKLSDEVKSSFADASEKGLKLSLILEKIREVSEECRLSNDDAMLLLRDQLPQITSVSSQEDVENAIAKLSSEGMLSILINKIQDQYVLDYLVKTSTIVE